MNKFSRPLVLSAGAGVLVTCVLWRQWEWILWLIRYDAAPIIYTVILVCYFLALYVAIESIQVLSEADPFSESFDLSAVKDITNNGLFRIFCVLLAILLITRMHVNRWTARLPIRHYILPN